MKNSGFLSLGLKDLFKGMIVSILTVVLTGLIASLETGTLPSVHTLKALAITGAGAGLAYLLKNWLTNSNDQLLKKEAKN